MMSSDSMLRILTCFKSVESLLSGLMISVLFIIRQTVFAGLNPGISLLTNQRRFDYGSQIERRNGG